MADAKPLRELIGDAASDCPSVHISGDVYELGDFVLAALSAAGLKVVGVQPSKAALAVGAQALINSQPHNGVPQLAVFPAYEIWFAMVHAYDAAPPATAQGEKK